LNLDGVLVKVVLQRVQIELPIKIIIDNPEPSKKTVTFQLKKSIDKILVKKFDDDFKDYGSTSFSGKIGISRNKETIRYK